jgi:hypothetical protein
MWESMFEQEPEPDNETMLMYKITDEVRAERYRQIEKWGDQRHPDGTENPTNRVRATIAKMICDTAAQQGRVTWCHILAEEVMEAFAETDPAKIRAELIQVAAVCAAWISDIDRRPGTEDGGEVREGEDGTGEEGDGGA